MVSFAPNTVREMPSSTNYGLLYPMQMLPLLIKYADANRLNLAFVKFIWGGRRPRKALQKMMLSKDEASTFPTLGAITFHACFGM